MLSEFHFLRPLWLLALLPLALLWWQMRRAGMHGMAWRGVVDAPLLARLLGDDEHGGGRRLPLGLLGLAWLLVVLALAGPTWERLPEPLYQARQYRVIVLDLSPSMNATDLTPTRLARARFEVLDLLQRWEEGQTALIAYGAEPYIVAPLTTDVATIAAQVPDLETGLLPVSGARRTDLALELAGSLLRQAGAPDGRVILVTDGLDHPAAAGEAARLLLAAGYRVSVLGMGTDKGGPVAGPDGGLLKDAQGAIRVARLAVAPLQSLASAGGGHYVTARPDDRDIALLAADGAPAGMDAAGDEAAHRDRWREAGPWLLLLLLPLAALGFRRGWLSPLLLVVCVLPGPEAHALTWQELWLRPDQRGLALLEGGQPQRAVDLFERSDWRAAAQYRAGDYAQALASLEGLGGPEADYNRGNVLARLDRLDEALAAYDSALAAAPGHDDARHNRELVRALIDRRQREHQAEDTGDRADDPQAPLQQARQSPAGEPRETDETGDTGDTGDTAQQAQAGEQQGQQEDGQDSAQSAGQEGSQQTGEQAAAGEPQPAGAASAEGEAGSTSSAGGQASAAEQSGDRSTDARPGGAGNAQARASAGSQAPDAAGDTAGSEQPGGQRSELAEAPDAQGTQQAQAGFDAEPAGQADVQGSGGEQPAVVDAAGDSTRDTTGGERLHPETAEPAQPGDTTEPGERKLAEATPGHEATDGRPADAGGQAAQGDGPDGQGDDTRQARGSAPGATPDAGRGGDRSSPELPDPSAAADNSRDRPPMRQAAPRQPGVGDLLGDQSQAVAAGQGVGRTPGIDPEDRQAIEQMLRRVDDDPGGLLRQRFLLQHLRRSGQLP